MRRSNLRMKYHILRKRDILAGLVVALVLAISAPAGAQLPYSVSISEPSAGQVLTGSTTVRATVSGTGRSSVERAAFYPGSGWSEAEATSMSGPNGGPFTGTWDTTGWANGTYTLSVRAYDGNAYRSASVGGLKVNNAPPAPSDLSASTGSDSVSLSWSDVYASDRSDFVGYRVYRRSGDCSTADLGAYSQVAETQTTNYSSSLSPGQYCFRVTAVRTSPSSGTIA